MMMMISKSKSCYITSSRNDYYSTHHNSLYMPLPDLDSRLAYPRPRPRPRPRLKTYKTNTGDVEYDYWGDDNDRAVGRPSRAVGSRVETTPLPAGREAAAISVAKPWCSVLQDLPPLPPS